MCIFEFYDPVSMWWKPSLMRQRRERKLLWVFVLVKPNLPSETWPKLELNVIQPDAVTCSPLEEYEIISADINCQPVRTKMNRSMSSFTISSKFSWDACKENKGASEEQVVAKVVGRDLLASYRKQRSMTDRIVYLG